MAVIRLFGEARVEHPAYEPELQRGDNACDVPDRSHLPVSPTGAMDSTGGTKNDHDEK